MSETAWLRGVVESATPGEWEADVDGDRNDQPRVFGPTRDEWIALLPHQCLGSLAEQRRRDARAIAALHNVAPELLACVDELAAVRDEALATLAHYRARATGGQIVREPRMNVSTAIAIERDTRSVEALRAKVRACMEASRA